MKKILSFAALLLAFVSLSWGHDFSAVAPTGQTLYYEIHGSTVTVSPENTNYPYWSSIPTENLSIPSTVIHNNQTYSVTAIGKYAFLGCSSLTNVSIPNSVISIGDYAFYGCNSLNSVTIPNSVTAIGEHAFSYCSGLNSVTIGNSVTVIGEYAFYVCISLNSVTIPNSVTAIGEHAFSFCNGLTSITIGNSVRTIGNEAFYGCTGLTSVTIPNSVTSIGEYAFYGCNSLNSVTIPNSVTSIGNNAFDLVRNIVYHGTATGSPWGALCVNGYIDGDLVYTNSSKTYLVGCATTATSVTIPNSVTSIGYRAFYGCSGITSIAIPNSVTAIGNEAFYGCSGITSIAIPNSVTSIGRIAFDGCTGLTNVIFNATNCTSMGGSSDSRVFKGCPNLTSLTIGDSVQSIPSTAFYGCSGITSVTIPNSVTSIGEYAFYGCSSLNSVTIPNSVTYIDGGAFSGCSGLTSVTIPNSVTSIGDHAFHGCTGLSSVTIPTSVTRIGDGAFENCSGLTSVSFNAVHCSYVTGMNLIYLEAPFHSVFADCTNLTSLTIGDCVQTIPAYAFRGCSGITSLSIPNSVTSIGDYAFYGCRELTGIKSLAFEAPQLGMDALGNVTSTIPVYIPCGSSASYVSRWSYFSNFVESAGILLNATAADSTQGIVRVQTEPTCDNPTAVIFAAANTGYSFDHWSDGNTDNPRTITVTADATYIAYFESTQGIEDVDGNDITVRVVNGHIVIAGTGDEPVRLFDCMGRLIHIERQPSESCDFIVPTTGIYLIQIGTHRAQKVAVLW